MLMYNSRDRYDHLISQVALRYNRTYRETAEAMQSYASQYPLSWFDINWDFVDLSPYFQTPSDSK